MDNQDLLGNISINQNGWISFPSTTGNSYSISGDMLANTFNGSKVGMTKKTKMPPRIFFKLMKRKMGILKDYKYKKRIEKLEQAVKKAEELGQIAFSEELFKKLLVLVREAEIYAFGLKIFLSRDIYEEFKNKTERAVRLTPLKNYARPIPQSVLDKKIKCDENKLFNGYVVMHYDEPGAVKEKQKEEIEKYLSQSAFIFAANAPFPVENPADLQNQVSAESDNLIAAVYSGDKTKVDEYAQKAQAGIDQMKKVAVPYVLKDIHKLMLQLAIYTSNLKDDISLNTQDPIKSLAAASSLQVVAQGAMKLQSEFSAILTEYDIEFINFP